MINSFSQYLIEEERVVYFTFGRMNPPTIGHGKLLDTIASKSGRNPYRVYLSQSADAKKNPLSYSDKVKHVRKMFPKHARSVMINKKVKTAIDALVALYDEGFRKVVMVVGSDRVREFDILLNKYNGQQARHGFYNFKSIDIVSAGARDPDAEGVEGMSASKQRDNASKNDFTTFAQGLPKTMSNNDARRLFNDVRKGMGLKEARDFKRHIELSPVSQTREQFVQGELFELGEQVIIKKTDEVGTITVLGSNYVIVETADRKTRQWLDAVEKIEEAARWKKAGPNGEIEINHKGQKYKIEKALDHNERHKGEFKIMVWDKRSRDWEWDNTVRGKAYAKEIVMDKLEEKTLTKAELKKRKEVADAIKRDNPGMPMDKKMAIATSVAKKTAEAYQPGEGTPQATARAKKMTPGETAMDVAKQRIDREKKSDAKKHDRILDRARIVMARKKNRETKA